MGESQNLDYLEKCECGGKLVRVRRRFWQRLFYAAVYRCSDCKSTRTRRTPALLFSRSSVCPRCGTGRLKVLRKRDPVDTMSTSIVSGLQKMLGAELHHCEFCRLQFYDFRRVTSKKVDTPA